jgi:uncharacterized protein (TIGR03066 family)
MTRKAKILLGFAALATVAVAAASLWAGFGRSVANKRRLIGTWAFVSGGNGWRGTTLTFARDGKMKTTSQWAGKTYESEGTYTVKGDTIEMLVADDSDWGGWGDWAKRGGGGKSDGSNPDTKSRPQSQPKQQREPTLRRVTIRSLTETELVVADGTGQKTVYAPRK